MVSLHRNTTRLYLNALFVCFVFGVIYDAPVAETLGTFSLDIHHRYSDTVNNFLGSAGLPEKDSVEYFTSLVHRDHLRGRRLAGEPEINTRLVFAGGNATLQLPLLQFLHYTYVWFGTPYTRYIVALDTGSDLFWLPCDCTDCPRNVTMIPGQGLTNLNIYSVNNSSSETTVTCKSSLCGANYQCLKEQNVCAYETNSLSVNASSVGILLEDVMQLAIEDPITAARSRITFGCGLTQTGGYLSTFSPNGVLGLGMGDISVPSILASQGLIANSFSMCYGPDGIGRIVLGDKGSSNQEETPLSSSALFPTYYNVNVEQVSVGIEVIDVEFTALFDSGVAFTMLSSPVYTTLTKSFDSQVLVPRRKNTELPFEYCYNISSLSQAPNITFVLKSQIQFGVNPLMRYTFEDSSYVICLAVIRTENINIIGQNFMTGYRVVFDREKKILGLQKSNCYDDDRSEDTAPSSTTPYPPPPPKNPPPTRTTTRSNSTDELPVSPSDTNGTTSPAPSTGKAARLNLFPYKVVIALLLLICQNFNILD